jgi:hypothetical protein
MIKENKKDNFQKFELDVKDDINKNLEFNEMSAS